MKLLALIVPIVLLLAGCATDPTGPHRSHAPKHTSPAKRVGSPPVSPAASSQVGHPSAPIANPAPVSRSPQAKPKKVREHWWQVWRKKNPKQ